LLRAIVHKNKVERGFKNTLTRKIMSALQQPFLQELNNDPVRDYRLAYKRFRTGHYIGAKGESNTLAQPTTASASADDDIEDFTVFGDSSGQHDAVHQAINAFRLQ
jgi:hypothetical protein